MTMLAQFLAAKGVQIIGSDISEIFMTDAVLKKAKIKVLSPFAAQNVPSDVDLIVYSIAYSEQNNEEMAEARKTGIKMMSYSEAVGEAFSQHQGIAVCGSHGKTTVSAWLGYVLWQCGLQPNVLVGANVPQFKGSDLIGRTKLFVAEADEYGNKLQYFFPYGVLLNNVDYDHPDYFKTSQDYTKVFAAFIKKIPKAGFLVVDFDDPIAKRLAKNNLGQTISYSLKDKTANYFANNIRLERGKQVFSVYSQQKYWGEIKTILIGDHNVANALATIAGAIRLGAKKKDLIKSLGEFKGTARRLQTMGEYRGAKIIDDYGHHPTEIKATLAALRSLYPKRELIVLFHPHTFSRTAALFTDFSTSFSAANQVMVMDIYSSAREKKGKVTAQGLAAAIRLKSRVKTSYLKDIVAATKYFKTNLKSNQILLLLGAGDVFRVGENLLYGKKK